MFSILLSLHSLNRWLVFLGLIALIVRALYALSYKKTYSKLDHTFRSIVVICANIQLMIGFTLYFNSMIVTWFFKHMADGIKTPSIAFFGAFHVLMMSVAIIFFNGAAGAVKAAETDEEKFKKSAMAFSIVLFLIFISIPWPFSPVVARPLLRY